MGLPRDAGRPWWSYYRLDVVCVGMVLLVTVAFGVWFFSVKGISEADLDSVLKSKPDMNEVQRSLGRPLDRTYSISGAPTPKPPKPEVYVIYKYDLKGPKTAFISFDQLGKYMSYELKPDKP